MKFVQYLFGPVFKHFFAIIITVAAFSTLVWGDLSETGKTRMEDLVAMVVGYYFLASMSGSKKDDTIDKMADTQKQLVDTNTLNSDLASGDVIKSGDPVTVIKE